MRKGILVFAAIVLIGIVVYAIWYINRKGELSNNSKDSFIPNNSALVISFNSGACLSDKIQSAFSQDIQDVRKYLLYQAVDTLVARDFVVLTSRVLALRMEGKRTPVFLWVMDNRDVLSRNEIIDFFKTVFPTAKERVRKYGAYRINSLEVKGEKIHYAIEEGMILLSDSELYVEDALKQFETEKEGKKSTASYENINKYFSAGSGMNIFLNRTFFSEFFPRFFQIKKLFPELDITQCFKWGALDGDVLSNGIVLNGFMNYSDMNASFMKTLYGQYPKESSMENVVPANVQSLLVLSLSDWKGYLGMLDNYRYDSGIIERIRKKKQEYVRLLGKNAEVELTELLQGEFAFAGMAFNSVAGEMEGAVVAGLKSGGLCRTWIEAVLNVSAKVNNVHPESYRRVYKLDKEQTFTYYKFPAEDLPFLYWGGIFGGAKARYALVIDNYLFLASSEKVIVDVLKSHIHHNYIKDAEWYKQLKTKISVKSNLAYFADMPRVLPYYENRAGEELQKYMASHEEELSVFSALAIQYANEGDILYNTIFLNTDEIRATQRPHLLWQTKLGAGVTMKPVPVVNHNTQERELFVQDESHTIYLLNASGRVLWQQKIDGAINSKVYQVDALKNGKLQYLFSTSSRIYLIDRNGHPVKGFPVSLKSPCEQGITVFDYDNNKTYRIFVPCVDQRVYLYDIKGTLVKGWNSPKADKKIVSPVEHYRVEGKDYIVYADRYRLYILDRKGNERVRVSSVLDLSENTQLYLMKYSGKSVIAFSDGKGTVNIVDFGGHLKQIECGKYVGEVQMNVADVNGDGLDEFIFTVGGKLMVYNQKGTDIYEKELDAGSLDFPYVYRFSNGDVRIGLIDRERHNMFMLSLKNGLSKGFPISGDSPFSIVFSDNGDFYLFAGEGNGGLIKYRVQR